MMLRRALPLVLAALVIAPTLAQDRAVTPPRPRAAATAQAPATYFPERFDWQHKTPEEVGMNAALRQRGGAAGDCRRHARHARHDAVPEEQLRQGAVRHAGRTGQGSRSGQRHHHPPRLHRRRVGRPETRRHRQQRHQDVPDDGGRAGVAAGTDQGRERLRARLHAAARGSVRRAEHNQNIKWDHLLRQTSDWQGTLWGKPDWADRPVGATPDELGEPQAVRAGHALQVQRRARQRDGAGGAAGVAPAAAARCCAKK